MDPGVRRNGRTERHLSAGVTRLRRLSHYKLTPGAVCACGWVGCGRDGVRSGRIKSARSDSEAEDRLVDHRTHRPFRCTWLRSCSVPRIGAANVPTFTNLCAIWIPPRARRFQRLDWAPGNWAPRNGAMATGMRLEKRTPSYVALSI